MYKDTVTIFNKSGSEKKGFVWHPTVLSGVNLIIDKNAGMQKTGLADANKADLHVRYRAAGPDIYIGDKRYLHPKSWDELSDQHGVITFSEGEDFFIEGEYPENVISEADSLYANGLFAFMKSRYDNVFKINTVGLYKMIPHFEIGGE